MTFRRSFLALGVVALLGACGPSSNNSLSMTVLAGSDRAALGAQVVVSPVLAEQLASLADGASVGVVIVSFRTSGPLLPAHLAVLQGLGVTRGATLPNLGMVAAPLTAGQARALASRDDVRSLWDNRRLSYLDHQARTLGGVERVRGSAAFTALNQGLPVTGHGVGVVINDSGIDARHDDLLLGTRVVQNVLIATDTGLVAGFTPLLAVENVPDTDLNSGHGTHCAGIVGGSGQDSGGLYSGVAPGAKLIGTGSGAALFILNALGGFEWTLANKDLYGIRIISNSWSPSGTQFEPDDPINVASRRAHDAGIVVVFAAGNSGPGKGTLNPFAKAPWVIGVAAGTKEGG
ncbi:MAG TPA: S8 family serine peptidase, partial [Myxococcales bacterium]|nr:S8 family serine peptidase [Myxococcales bacterium]